MIKQRTQDELTAQEIRLFGQFCIDNGIVTEGLEGEAQVIAIAEYIAQTWKVEITVDSLERAVEAFNRAGQTIAYHSPAKSRYRKIAVEDVKRADQLNTWVQSNNNRTLVKGGGDDDLENQTALLGELRGRELTSENIYAAIGRCSTRGLHFAPTSRKVDPRQHEDTDSFAPKDESNRKYVGGKLNHAYKEPGIAQDTPKTEQPANAWQQLAESLLHYGTHGQQAAMLSLFKKADQQEKAAGQSMLT